MNAYSLDINPKHNKAILSDPIKTMVLFDYNIKTHKMTPLSRFVCDKVSN
jgi:hypothetical protein